MIELDTLRRQQAGYALAIGQYQAGQDRAVRQLDSLIRKGCFLCAYRKRLKKLKAQLLNN